MYPLNVYPENAQIYGLVDGDKCCRCRNTKYKSYDLSHRVSRRHCVGPSFKCGHDEYGCDTDADCEDGHECTGSGTDRKCVDIDECTDPR